MQSKSISIVYPPPLVPTKIKHRIGFMEGVCKQVQYKFLCVVARFYYFVFVQLPREIPMPYVMWHLLRSNINTYT